MTAYAEITSIQASPDRVPRLDDLLLRTSRLERRLTWSQPSPAASLFARLQQLIDRATTTR